MLDLALRHDVEPRFDRLLEAGATGSADLIAPDLMWSEATSVLRLKVHRGELSREGGSAGLRFVERAPIVPARPPALRRRAWEIAGRMGWARTYDAEYCALAEIHGARLVTEDARLHRASRGRLDYVVTLAEALTAGAY